MSISFKTAGHAFAAFFKKVVADAKVDAPKVQADIAKVEDTKTEVEVGTTAVLGAVSPGAVVPAVGIESAAYAVLGEISALITAGGAAAEAKLVNAGLDQNVVATAKAVAASASQVATLVAAAK